MALETVIVEIVERGVQGPIAANGVIGPASSTDGHIPQFDGPTGKLLKDGKAAPTGTIVGTTDTQTLTNKTLTAPAIASPTGITAADVGALSTSLGGTVAGDLIVTYSNPSGPVRLSVGNSSSGGSASATRDMFTGLANATMLESLNNSGFFSRSFGSAVIESYDNCDGHIWRTQAGSVKASLTSSLFDVKSPETITSTSANALAVGANGSTNPAFKVDASTASSATGLQVKSAAAAGGVALSVLSSGTNEDIFIDAKGSGQVKLGYTSTGFVQTSRNLIVGIGTGARYVRANGGNSTNGGSAFLMDLAGSFDSGFGHKSAILGGAFDPTAMLYVAGGGTMELRAGSQTQITANGGNITVPNGAVIVSTYVKLGSYTVATVPSASAAGAGAEIYVSNETGGAVTAFSDSTNWRRVTDRAIIS
jgi:hypothetical protein